MSVALSPQIDSDGPPSVPPLIWSEMDQVPVPSRWPMPHDQKHEPWQLSDTYAQWKSDSLAPHIAWQPCSAGSDVTPLCACFHAVVVCMKPDPIPVVVVSISHTLVAEN